MSINKNGVNYTITELTHKWKITRELDTVDVDYEVSKKDCETLEDVKTYIEENALF